MSDNIFMASFGDRHFKTPTEGQGECGIIKKALALGSEYIQSIVVLCKD